MLKLQPENVLNYVNLASIASQLGRIELAEKVLVEATKACPEVAFPFGELARIGLDKRNFASVREWAAMAQKLDSQNIEWYLMSAIAAEALGDTVDLANLLEQARRISPNDPRLEIFVVTHSKK